jgi:poly(hydroxyalkanoate) granule-associated protein
MATAKKKSTGKGESGGGKRDMNALFSANQVWLAGLGALGRSQGRSSKRFEDLVREGQKLQGQALDTAQKVVLSAFKGAKQSVRGAQHKVETRVTDVRDHAQDTWDNLEKIFQTRVQRALHQLGMPTAEEITALARKVEELGRKVEKLSAAKAAASKGARRRGRGRTGSTEGAIPPGGT